MTGRAGAPTAASVNPGGGGVRTLMTRVLVTLTLLLGTVYVGWRWVYSVNWGAWWIAVPLVLAETYSLVDAYLFGLCMWRVRRRGDAPPAPR